MSCYADVFKDFRMNEITSEEDGGISPEDCHNFEFRQKRTACIEN